jgi:hypothetical protein
VIPLRLGIALRINVDTHKKEMLVMEMEMASGKHILCEVENFAKIKCFYYLRCFYELVGI